MFHSALEAAVRWLLIPARTSSNFPRIVSPCTYKTAVHMWFKRASGELPACPARFRGLLKKRNTLQILECKKQSYGSLLRMARCFVCHNWRNKVIPVLHRSVHALKQRQYGLLQAIPGCIIPEVVNRTFGNRTQSNPSFYTAEIKRAVPYIGPRAKI